MTIAFCGDFEGQLFLKNPHRSLLENFIEEGENIGAASPFTMNEMRKFLEKD
jgi:hypothetical protein